MSPEYVKRGKVSPKLDAFAFGVCLLELLSGRRPTEDLLELFDTHAEAGTVAAILDQRLHDWVPEEAEALLSIAMRCQEMLPSRRSSVVQVLPLIEELLVPYE
jgi:serine/threonine protein kinase